ncbi:MAG: glycerol-3-phosphate 1-O-acyltransferase [Gammaproteobacteria bacterium]|nr:glycerol-3-phosphate 1-O-acyltransferase [Gammaproteobacteria bacterium]|tara:strand:+ start:4300 stop:6723 length:2424 start_codon:yes stop_codon:yes gene_type:complete
MELIDQIKSFQYHATRWILFTWIKPTILGCSKSELNPNSTDIVYYVLPFRSTADLMVADKACEWAGLPRPLDQIEALDEKRAFFFLGQPEGLLGRKTQSHHSERMLRIFGHQYNTSDDIQIVPISLFWGHQPDREKSIFKQILSENWSVTSRFKKLLAILFHRSHILVQFSKPLRIRAITESDSSNEIQVRKLLRVLRVHFSTQRQAIIGPDLSHRRTLIDSMMRIRDIRLAIESEASEKGITIEQAEKRALAYANEIASHLSYRAIRFFYMLLSWLWNHLYDGIDLNNIGWVKQFAPTHEIVYIPCHRSHIDYLLLSYVLYENGLMQPHIAAGKNLNMPIIGPLLRRCGAFYMRRTFHGDPLYKAVFDEYIHQIFTRGYSMEYFIEGGRSRTGRTLNPRTGMLSMTLRSFQKNASRPICLMPVYFGYERVLESYTYMSELAGKDKKAESVFDIFKVFGSFKYSFGKVTVNFGEPLLLAEFLDQELPNWQQTQEKADISNTCLTLATELATRINSATAVKVVGIVATALLSTPRQTIEERHLLNQIELLTDMARSLEYSDAYTVTNESPQEMLDKAITIAGIDKNEHPFGVTISASNRLSILLTYYRNNISHLFALPSLIARYIKTEENTTLAEVRSFCEKLYPFLASEYFLRWSLPEVKTQCRKIIDLFVAKGLVIRRGENISAATQRSGRYASLNELSEIVEPTLERFHIVLALLMQEENRTVRNLESDAGAIAQQLCAIYGINSPDFFERSLFSSFINTLQSAGLVSVADDSVVKKSGFAEAAQLVSHTLAADVQHNVLQAIPE